MKGGRVAVVLNAGRGAWAFEAPAERLARVLDVPVSDDPGERNYLLGWDEAEPPGGRSFIPPEAIRISGDKRELARVFQAASVATPITWLLDTEAEVRERVAADQGVRWVLKWPTGCGAAGHRLLDAEWRAPQEWPRPFVVQEFVEMPMPEVYRLYCVAGETFGWNVRRFPAGVDPSPWVAHARGAVYEACGSVPETVATLARQALAAVGLLASFGCVDLVQSRRGWLVLEVNTDGVSSVVDRDIPVGGIRDELDERLRRAFWKWVEA